MKKPLFVALLFVLVILSFVGGARFSQHGAVQDKNGTGERQILHYVDPMDPSHISKEPGIAPCGMPMEPVYADEDGFDGSMPATALGTVRVNGQKQQIIGVQVGEVKRAPATQTIRALGRIVPDENRVYALIAGSDGWMGEVHESTTGSLVSKNQLLAKIQLYDYDFYTWQQRYLTEMSYAGRRSVYLSPTSGAIEQLEKIKKAREEAGLPFVDAGAPIALSKDGAARGGAHGGMESMGMAPDTQVGPSAETGPTGPPMGESNRPGSPTYKGIPPGVLHYGDAPSTSAGQPSPPAPDRSAGMPGIDNTQEDLSSAIGPFQVQKPWEVPELPTGPGLDLPMDTAPELPMDTAPGLPTGSSTGMAGPDGTAAPGSAPSTDGPAPVSPGPATAAPEAVPGSAPLVAGDQPVSSGPLGSAKPTAVPSMSAPGPHQGMEEMTPPAVPAATAADPALQPPAAHQHAMASPEMDEGANGPGMTQAKNRSVMNQPVRGSVYFVKEDDILYASKARQELLDLGVTEGQLARLAESGVYVTYVELRSPVNGLVLSRTVSPHQKIDRGAECFRIADLSEVWIEADIYDIEAGSIRPGMTARISLPGQDRSFEARVSAVPPEFDAKTRTLKVRLEMDNPHYRFRPDMFVDVQFLLSLPETVVVPAGAVIDSGTRKTVYVALEEGVFEPRAVRTGWQRNSRIEILDGLSPGEKIVTSGNFLIDSESRMKLAAARLMESPATISAPETLAAPAAHAEAPMAMPMNTGAPDGQTVADPVCGMAVDPVEAAAQGLVIEAQGETFYFCSEECAREFHRHGPQTEASPVFNPMTDMAAEPENAHEMDAPQVSSAEPSAPQQPVVDPVCKMEVDAETARSAGLVLEAMGETYYFCSEYCRDHFDPAQHGHPLDPAPASAPGIKGQP